MDDLAQRIEEYLLDKGDWVSSAEICQAFGLPDDRPLRATGGVPGLCTPFAISRKGGGFRHVAQATTTEWLRFKHAQRRHAIGEMCRVRDLGRRRKEVTRTARNFQFERDTGQGVLLPGVA
jgi:hypothetical protein